MLKNDEKTIKQTFKLNGRAYDVFCTINSEEKNILSEKIKAKFGEKLR